MPDSSSSGALPVRRTARLPTVAAQRERPRYDIERRPSRGRRIRGRDGTTLIRNGSIEGGPVQSIRGAGGHRELTPRRTRGARNAVEPRRRPGLHLLAVLGETPV